MVRPGAGESGDSSMKSALFCDMPLFSALLDANLEARHAFHMPGHRSLQSFPSDIKSRLLQLDTTELPSTADLMHPQGAALEAMERAASFFGAGMTRFLTCGSTSGVLTMLAVAAGRGGRVLLTRDVHQSVMHGIAVLGLQPVFIPQVARSVSCVGGVPDVAALRRVIETDAHAKTLFLTCPNYYGETYPLQTICDLAHRTA